MPTAQKFHSFGRGNGFPFCPPKVNVSGEAIWTTLSGVNSSNVGGFSADDLQVKIAESLILASRLYSHLYSITITYENNSIELPVVPPEKVGELYVFTPQFNQTEVDQSITDAGGLSEVIAPEPFERACPKSFYPSPMFGGSGSREVFFSEFSDIKRYYNGDTSDESKFVGYGCTELLAGLSSADGLSIELYGAYGFTSSGNATVGFGSIGDYHFVGNILIDPAYWTTGTPNMSDLSVTGTYWDPGTSSTTLSFDALNFYT